MELEELFASVLNVPAAQLDDQSGPANLRSWDSLRHMRLIALMEDLYGVTFSSAEIRGLKSLGGARALLQSKGVELAV